MITDTAIQAVFDLLEWQCDRLREAYAIMDRIPNEGQLTLEAERIAKASGSVDGKINTDDVRRNTIIRAAAIVGARV